MRIFRCPVVVLDTETTGFPGQDWSRVIELAGVLLGTDGSEVDSWSSLIMPDVLDERAEGALEVNRITPEMLRGQPSAYSALQSWRGWLGTHHTPWVTAFNVPFDRPMLERSGWRHDRWASCVMARSMDVMGPAGALVELRGGKRKWPKLSEAAEFFGVQVDGDAHRALTDARTAARIAVEIRRRELAATASAEAGATP